MSRNSTLEFWDLIFKKKFLSFDILSNKFVSRQYKEPKKETLNNILTYAESVKGVKTKSGDNILIFLN